MGDTLGSGGLVFNWKLRDVFLTTLLAVFEANP